MHRGILFVSDESKGYKYSGQISEAIPLGSAPLVTKCMNTINNVLDTKFNGVLINRYLNGEKYIGAHSDDETGLDPSKSMVVGISYGATRKFRIRDKLTGKIVLDYHQKSGTLLVMEGDFQKEFTHEIPQEKRVKTERISMTFRCHTS